MNKQFNIITRLITAILLLAILLFLYIAYNSFTVKTKININGQEESLRAIIVAPLTPSQ